MPSLNTPALVLRHAEYKDYDRMVTLFTPEHGRVDAIARGCRRPRSPLVNATEPFTSGEYQLFLHRDRCTVEQCSIHESFYDLRMDYERLTHGIYWLKLLETVVLPDTEAPELFLITLKALAHLSYSDLPVKLLTMAFEMHLMAQSGMSPCMDACMLCGAPVNGDARFDIELGGVICGRHSSSAPVISNGARRIVMKLPRTRFEQVPLVEPRPEWPEAARHFRRYVERRLHTEKNSPEPA